MSAIVYTLYLVYEYSLVWGTCSTREPMYSDNCLLTSGRRVRIIVWYGLPKVYSKQGCVFFAPVDMQHAPCPFCSSEIQQALWSPNYDRDKCSTFGEKTMRCHVIVLNTTSTTHTPQQVKVILRSIFYTTTFITTYILVQYWSLAYDLELTGNPNATKTSNTWLP